MGFARRAEIKSLTQQIEALKKRKRELEYEEHLEYWGKQPKKSYVEEP